MNIETKTCRACLSQADNLHPLFFDYHKSIELYNANTILNMFITCTSLEATQYDQYPKHICHNCLRDLNTAYEFWKRCRNSIEELNHRNESLVLLKSEFDIKPEISNEEKLKDPSRPSSDQINTHKSLEARMNDVKVCPENNLNYFYNKYYGIDQQNPNTNADYGESTSNSKSEGHLPFIQDTKIIDKNVEIDDDNETYETPIFDLEDQVNYKINLIQNSLQSTSNKSSSDDKMQSADKIKPKSSQKRINKHKTSANKTKNVLKEKTTKSQNEERSAKSHLCHECGKSFAKPSLLIRHSVIHSDFRAYKCETCGAQFKIKANFTVHLRIHNPDPNIQYKCEHCDKIFDNWNKRYVHTKLKHLPKSFICEVCSKAFALKRFLDSHMKTHTGEKPHPCTVCGRKFSNKSTLKEHMRTHTGEKRFSCTVCDRRFTFKKNVVQHMVTHTGIRKHECDICKKTFTQRHVLRSHLKMHEKDKQIQV